MFRGLSFAIMHFLNKYKGNCIDCSFTRATAVGISWWRH